MALQVRLKCCFSCSAVQKRQVFAAAIVIVVAFVVLLQLCALCTLNATKRTGMHACRHTHFYGSESFALSVYVHSGASKWVFIYLLSLYTLIRPNIHTFLHTYACIGIYVFTYSCSVVMCCCIFYCHLLPSHCCQLAATPLLKLLPSTSTPSNSYSSASTSRTFICYY